MHWQVDNLTAHYLWSHDCAKFYGWVNLETRRAHPSIYVCAVVFNTLEDRSRYFHSTEEAKIWLEEQAQLYVLSEL